MKNIEIFITSKLRYQLENNSSNQTVQKLIKSLDNLQRYGNRKGINLEKLNNRNNTYSIKIDKNYRAFAKLLKMPHLQKSGFVFFDYGPHDKYGTLADYIKINEFISIENFLHKNLVEAPPPDRIVYNLTQWIKELEPNEKPPIPSDYEWEKMLQLTPAQQEIIFSLTNNKPMLVQGGAGTGKTTAAIYRALHCADLLEAAKKQATVYLISFDDYLCKVLQYYINVLRRSLAHSTVEIKISPFSDFVTSLAQEFNIVNNPPKKEKIIEDRLKKAIQSKQINTPPEELYQTFCSVKLTARRGANKTTQNTTVEEQCELLKKWWEEKKAPFRDSINDILAIFKNYEKLGNVKGKKIADKADIILAIYQKLQDESVSLPEGLYIIVDEVQDLAEMELALLRKLLEKMEKKRYRSAIHPFMLFGDEHQQVRLTDFKWNDFITNSFIDRRCKGDDVFKHVITLEQNVRNTREIALVDKYLFNLIQGDSIHTFPELPVESRFKPMLFIAKDHKEMIRWLRPFLDQALPKNLALLFEDNRVHEQLKDVLRRWNRFAISVKHSKGLEFEDMILIGLFSSYPDNARTVNDVTQEIRNSWHVAISRARTNLMVWITERELQLIQKRIFLNKHKEFLECFDLIPQDQWNSKANDFIKRCQKKLFGINEILQEAGKAMATWKKFLASREREDRLEALARFRNNQEGLKEAIKLLEEYFENNEKKPEIKLELAVLWDDLGNHEKSRQEINNFFLLKSGSKLDKNLYLLKYLSRLIDPNWHNSGIIASTILPIIDTLSIKQIYAIMKEIENEDFLALFIPAITNYFLKRAQVFQTFMEV